MADSEDAPLTAEHREELERRWLDMQEHPDDAEPWDEVKKALQSE
jgi:putative addiction module component (TIGR02574 family)